MITMNTPWILKGNQFQFTVFWSIDVTLCEIMAVMFGEINTISVSENSIMNMPHLQPQNSGKMKRRIKTLHSKMVTMYSFQVVLREAKLPLFWSINRLTQRDVLRDVLHALMFWGRLVTSNGGRIYEHAIKRVVVGLIPLKLHPKRFWKKGNLVKIKRNNRKW